MALVWQASDAYPWVLCLQNFSSVQFKSIRSNEGRQRGTRRVEGPLGQQAVQGSLAWPKGFREQGIWVGEGKLNCMLQESDGGGGEAVGESRDVFKVSNAFCLVSVQIRASVSSFVLVFRFRAICANSDILGATITCFTQELSYLSPKSLGY